MSDDVYDVNTPRAYHHGDLRRTLVEVALKILAEEGREALTLRSLARRAGVSAMAPYRHFADKSALLTAVGEFGFTLLRDRLQAADQESDPRQALADLAVAHVSFAAEHPDLFRLMFGSHPRIGGDAAELANRPDTSYGILAARLRALFPAEQMEMATLTVWSFSHGLASLVIDSRLRPTPVDTAALTRQAAMFLTERLVGGAP